MCRSGRSDVSQLGTDSSSGEVTGVPQRALSVSAVVRMRCGLNSVASGLALEGIRRSGMFSETPDSIGGPSRTRTLDPLIKSCLLYTSDAADERSSVDLGGRRIIKKKNYKSV